MAKKRKPRKVPKDKLTPFKKNNGTNGTRSEDAPAREDTRHPLSYYKALAVIESTSNGTPLKKACESASVAKTTFWRVLEDHPDLKMAYNDAKVGAIMAVEDGLFMAACGYEYEKLREISVPIEGTGKGKIVKKILEKGFVGPDVQAAIFFLKNRGRGEWKNDMQLKIETSHIERREISIEISMEKVLEEMTDEELEVIDELTDRLAANAGKASGREPQNQVAEG